MRLSSSFRSTNGSIPRPYQPALGTRATSKSDRIKFLGINIDPLTLDSTIALAAHAMENGKRLQHGDVNVAKLVAFRHDLELRRCTAESDIICADGMGVVWGCRLMGVPVPERVAGCDLMGCLVELCAERGFRPYFLGATHSVLEDAIAAVQRRHPRIHIAGWNHGYFSTGEEPAVVARIRDSQADCLFVGMSSPLKEQFLNRYRDELGVPVQVCVGGSFDILAGHLKRAPLWMQVRGLEWLFRLGQEPSRLWRRYLISSGQYAGMLTLALAGKFFRRLFRDRSNR